MNLHFPPFTLENENLKILKKAFPWLENENIRTFSSPENAIAEMILALQHMQPHKSNVYIQDGDSPYTSEIATFFSKKGIKLKPLKLPITEVDENAFLYIFVKDNPFTGELFPNDSVLKQIHEKRIFSLSIYHSQFLISSFQESNNPFASHLYCLQEDLAFLSLSSRAKKVPPALPRSTVSLAAWEPVIIHENENLILEMEKQLQDSLSGLQLYFTAEQNRMFDRVVFHIPKCNGEKVLHLLGDCEAYTSSPCAHSHPFQMAWWQNLDDAKSWVVIPLNSLRPDLPAKISKLI
tara:strand:- start:1597 stop:2475 length:879 start_codon:yes stop_codon:yes gene_type:complete